MHGCHREAGGQGRAPPRAKGGLAADTRPQQGPRSSWGRRPEGGGLPLGSCWLPLESWGGCKHGSRKEGAAGHAAEDEVSPAGCNQTAEPAACSKHWRTPGFRCPNSTSSLLGEINALLHWQRRRSCCSPPTRFGSAKVVLPRAPPLPAPHSPHTCTHVPAPRVPGRPTWVPCPRLRGRGLAPRRASDRAGPSVGK